MLAVDAQLRGLRSALTQRRELAASACRRDVLKRPTTRAHQANDHPGELLSQRRRPTIENKRDRVDPM